MKKSFIKCILILTFLFVILPSFTVHSQENVPEYVAAKTLSAYSETEMPETKSGSISVYNKETNLIVYEKKADTRCFPASSVKIMTAIIAYENIHDKSTPIKISRNVVNNSVGLKLGLKKDDVYSAEDLIRAVLICGSNDAANQLAEYVSGNDMSSFIKMMNDKAVDLGCKNTNFTNVTGLHDEKMYTTASDMMKIAIYAYSLTDLAEWASAPSYTFTPLESPQQTKPITKPNRNSFISASKTSAYLYKNAKGLSLGWTEEGGNCLITSASRNGITYVCVFMNCPISEKNDASHEVYSDAKKILNKCFSSFQFKTVLSKNSISDEVKINLAANIDHISLSPENEISYLLPVDLSEKDITFDPILYKKEYDAPVHKGLEMGEVIVRYKNDFIIGKSKLVCADDIERSPVLHTISIIKKFLLSIPFMAFVATAILLFILYTVYTIVHRQKSNFWYRR